MPEPRDQTAPLSLTPAAPLAFTPAAPIAERLRELPGLTSLLAEAEHTWRARAAAAGDADDARPGWRTFEDAFPTFYEFTNRPR